MNDAVNGDFKRPELPKLDWRHQPWTQLHGGAAFILAKDYTEKRIIGPYTIENLAHALSYINRYTGNSNVPINVASHSLVVSYFLDVCPKLAILGLFHDAHEAVINDISSPMKLALDQYGANGALKHIERVVDFEMHDHFGLLLPDMDQQVAIKRADMIACSTEYRDCLDKTFPWGHWLSEYPAHPNITPTTAAHISAKLFVSRFRELQKRAGLHLPGPQPCEEIPA